jgi:chromate reductase
MRILGISGSLRPDSWNSKLLAATGGLVSDDVEFAIYEGLKAIPPYDERDDRGGGPEPVRRLREALDEADGVLFATPEYNSSVPGQLKNALDWVSRPLTESPIRNKPVAVIGASTGMFGAVWAQAELRKVLASLGARVVEAEVPVGHAPTRFDEDGNLVDDGIREQLAELTRMLVAEVRARSEQRVAA